MSVLRCNKCSLEFLSTFSHITDNFYQDNGMFKNQFDYSVWQKNSRTDDTRRFEFLKKRLKGSSVLDFGCGAGGFLKLVGETCKEAVGVEVNKPVLEFLLNNGFSVVNDVYELRGCKFDIITMFHVLEHIKNPTQTLIILAEYLKKGGEIVIEVPNSNDALLSSYNCKKYKKFAYWSCHLYLYNLKNLKRIIKDAGYKINYTKHIQRYGLFNHLRWAFRGEPDGHQSKHFLNNSFVNGIYVFFLKLLKCTDTVVVSISLR